MVNIIFELRDVIFNENRFISIFSFRDFVLYFLILKIFFFQGDDIKEYEMVELRSIKRVRKVNIYEDEFYIYLIECLNDKIENKSLYYYNLESDFIIFSEIMIFRCSILNRSNLR